MIYEARRYIATHGQTVWKGDNCVIVLQLTVLESPSR